jgi:hypothetical protein
MRAVWLLEGGHRERNSALKRNPKVEKGSQQPAHTLIDNLKALQHHPMRMHVAQARWGPGCPSWTTKLARV